ncbi:Thymus-specific serine protease [Pseudolycoriella hygida]|uniref:Thymus-specific serine protease n=1 Tax=Pseudolycoriella hygida TaxID=35572 RepID=A0A9Q0S0W1_9DIPT|nr:Thymus-specific serine protease [Pseudolycoriella hygida]
MGKLLIFVATLTIAFAAPLEKTKVPFFKLLAPRDPFPTDIYPRPIPQNISLETIEQRLDNFDPSNLAVWEQRYYVNTNYYEPGSPIFLFLAGEWTITPYRLSYSLMHDIASEINGSLYYLEHRYYGESRPTPNVSDANLRFLTPEQALADAAHFVNFIRTSAPGAENSPIILVGGHYSASLAVWFRARYPHLSAGVWASSAPLPSVVDFDQFKVATGAAFRTVGGDSCYNALEAGFGRMHELFDAGEFDILTETFHLCDPLEPEDAAHFFSLMAEIYAILPQFEFEEFIASTCDVIVDGEGSIESIAYILENFIDVVGGQCLDIDYDSIIDAERQTEWDSPAVVVGYRQWTYQLCSQIGWFHTSGSPDQPFGDRFPADLYHAGCQAVFGESFTEARLTSNSARFNTIYGGLEPDVSNAVFVYGQHDPWSVLGRRTNLSDDATAIIIQGATLGNDLGPRHPDNPPALRDAKIEIERLILEWIDEFN